MHGWAVSVHNRNLVGLKCFVDAIIDIKADVFHSIFHLMIPFGNNRRGRDNGHTLDE